VNDGQETILLVLVGTTPAVLTETVWALAFEEDPVLPDRIIALTTRSGADLLKEKLFTNGHWKDLKTVLSDRGIAIGNRLSFGPIGDSVRVVPAADRQTELEDVRSLADAEAMAEFCMETVRAFTESEHTRLIVSIAGGRKSSSALLHSVMTLLGRHDDRITHVLVDPEWERSDFFFPGCQGVLKQPNNQEWIDTSKVEITLMDVPFVPMRYFFERELKKAAGSFTRVIREMRSRVANLDQELNLIFDPSRGVVQINKTTIKPGANEYLLWLYFAERSRNGLEPLHNLAEVTVKDLQLLKDEWMENDNFDHWTHRSLEGFVDTKEDYRKWLGALRQSLQKHGFDRLQVERLIPRRGSWSIDLPTEEIQIIKPTNRVD